MYNIEIVNLNKDTLSSKINSELLDTLHQFCQIDVDKEVPVILVEDMFGRKKDIKTDRVIQIPKIAISRYLPLSVEKPYDQIDRLLLLHEYGFLLATVRPETVRGSRDMDIYDVTKYQEIYDLLAKDEDESFIDETVFKEDVIMVWIEILCVNPKYRRQNIGQMLIQSLNEWVTDNFKSASKKIIGIDVAGTRQNQINRQLKLYYEGQGFTFPIILPNGNIIGFKIAN